MTYLSNRTSFRKYRHSVHLNILFLQIRLHLPRRVYNLEVLHVLTVLPHNDGLPIRDQHLVPLDRPRNDVHQCQIVEITEHQETQSNGGNDEPLHLGQERRALRRRRERRKREERTEYRVDDRGRWPAPRLEARALDPLAFLAEEAGVEKTDRGEEPDQDDDVVCVQGYEYRVCHVQRACGGRADQDHREEPVEQQRWPRTLLGLIVVARPKTLSEEGPGSGCAAGKEQGEWKYAFFGDLLFYYRQYLVFRGILRIGASEMTYHERQ